ncbi:MAG: Fe-S cluster assembly sulfur transfer protein SufU [Actinomycetota bacterium]
MAGLEDLYKEIVIDHYRSPRNWGELETPPAKHAEGLNPLCGDEVHVYVQVEDGVITDIAIGGQGCSISKASASMMSAAIKGKSLSEVDELTSAVKQMMSIHEQSLDEDDSGVLHEPPDVELGDLEALKGVVKYPVRIKCATLSWHTLAEALQS